MYLIQKQVTRTKTGNPGRLTRSASCDLVHFLGQLESHKKSLKRIMSSPSLPISSFYDD